MIHTPHHVQKLTQKCHTRVLITTQNCTDLKAKIYSLNDILPIVLMFDL